MQEEFTIHQLEKYEGYDWWKWAVWIDGSDEALDRIEFVEWALHPTFPKPIRKIRNRKTKFRLSTAGWGVFQIVARLKLKDGQQIKLQHYLSLNYPDGRQTEN